MNSWNQHLGRVHTTDGVTAPSGAISWFRRLLSNPQSGHRRKAPPMYGRHVPAGWAAGDFERSRGILTFSSSPTPLGALSMSARVHAPSFLVKGNRPSILTTLNRARSPVHGRLPPPMHPCSPMRLRSPPCARLLLCAIEPLARVRLSRFEVHMMRPACQGPVAIQIGWLEVRQGPLKSCSRAVLKSCGRALK